MAFQHLKNRKLILSSVSNVETKEKKHKTWPQISFSPLFLSHFLGWLIETINHICLEIPSSFSQSLIAEIGHDVSIMCHLSYER